MNTNLNHITGKIIYWTAIAAGILAIFLLSWKIFGNSPEFDALISSLIVANILGTISFHSKINRTSNELRFFMKYSEHKVNETNKKLDNLITEFRNHVAEHKLR